MHPFLLAILALQTTSGKGALENITHHELTTTSKLHTMLPRQYGKFISSFF
jgi:hypothetical protein